MAFCLAMGMRYCPISDMMVKGEVRLYLDGLDECKPMFGMDIYTEMLGAIKQELHCQALGVSRYDEWPDLLYKKREENGWTILQYLEQLNAHGLL